MAALSSQTNLKKNDRRVSCETLCSSNSSCVLQKRKPLHPLATSVKSRTSSNPVTQRVLSAKLLRFKALQNQLNDANYHITQLVNENKILKNLQKKQDHALSKYEGTNAQLPQILESHQEEIRVLHVRNKNLRKTLKDLSDQLKSKDEEINSLKDQNKHLLSLCKNKNLEERKELQDKLEDLQTTLRQNENTISVLNRKLMLESKNYKFKLNSEINKHKHTQRELHKALSQLQEFSSRSEIKLIDSTHKRTPSRVRIQSLANLIDDKSSIIKTSEKLTSSSLTNLTEDVPSSSSSVKSTTNLQEETSSISSKSPEEEDSEVQLKEIVHVWNKRNSKLQENIEEEMKKYHEDMVEDVKVCSNTVDKHTEQYQNSMKDTEIILKTLKENDTKHERLSKLSHSGDAMNFYDYTVLSNKTSSDQLMQQILKSEKYSFEEDLLSTTTTEKLKISEPEVDHEDRKKLLATLKAIDNGDNVLVTDMKKAKCDLMKELFGS